ncbi:MAG: hypothetical protein PHW86_02745 [Candidatus Bipolaricaulis sp.]|nr:hypothetical protein [Candidatus Bipolaricaulis sp.]
MKRVLVLGVLVLGLLVTGISVSAATEAWIPGVASLFIPGFGQLLNDQMEKAIFHFVVGVAIYSLGFGFMGYYTPLAYLTPTIALAWGIYSGYDAYTVAKRQGFTIGFVPGGIGVGYSRSF